MTTDLSISHPTDLIPLTPNHFLHGQMRGRFAPDCVDSVAFNQRRWRRVQELVRHFWHRWLREWIPSLSARKKWHSDKANLKVSDIVIITSTEIPRGRWPLGRVVKSFLERMTEFVSLMFKSERLCTAEQL